MPRFIHDHHTSPRVQAVNDLLIWRQAALWAAQGHTVRLATVTQTWGSAPCPIGSAMIVCDDERFIGSVSGGCVEGAVLRAIFEQPTALGQTLTFNISTQDAWAVGLACGGEVRVLLWPQIEASIWEAMASHMEANRPVSLALDERSDDVCVWTVQDLLRQVEGATPAWLKRSSVRTHEHLVILTRAPRVTLIISGAVHIAQALCTMALCAGFECVVVDPRPTFAQVARFEADVRLMPCWPQELPATLWSTSSAVIAVSHDPKIDDPLVLRGFEASAFYVGALGSRKNQARRQGRLSQMGASSSDLERLDGPIGLDIGAVGASEIAVSILAKVIEVWRTGDA